MYMKKVKGAWLPSTDKPRHPFDQETKCTSRSLEENMCCHLPGKDLMRYCQPPTLSSKGKSSWIHASHANTGPEHPSQDKWETDAPGDFERFPGPIPRPRSSQHHEVDSFSQDHRSRSLTFTYLPFPTFKTPYTHTLKNRTLFLINKSFLCIY